MCHRRSHVCLWSHSAKWYLTESYVTGTYSLGRTACNCMSPSSALGAEYFVTYMQDVEDNIMLPDIVSVSVDKVFMHLTLLLCDCQ